MNAELTRALAFQRYRNLATLERERERPMIQRMTTVQWAQQIRAMIRSLGQVPPALSDAELVAAVAAMLKEAQGGQREGMMGTHPIRCWEGNEPLEEWRANARLIAAAPDMLEALRAAITVLTADRSRQGVHAYQLASAALAKAERK